MGMESRIPTSNGFLLKKEGRDRVDLNVNVEDLINGVRKPEI